MNRLFLDMDGTLTRFHDEVQYLERMWEKDFFRNLKPFQNMIDAVKLYMTQHPDTEVFILSAAIEGNPPYCCKEKQQWIDEHLPEVDKMHRIFTKVGVPKSSYISGGVDSSDYLIDDYNVNLHEWLNFGGKSIKCVNNINHKGLIGELWTGDLIRNTDAPDVIAEQISAIITAAPARNQSRGRR